MGEEFRKGLAFGLALAGVGGMTQLADKDAWYLPWLWVIAGGMVLSAPAIWFWPAVSRYSNFANSLKKRKVPLIEGARRAFERTHQTIVPAFARMFGSAEDDVLEWYCHALWERVPVFFGVQPPAQTPMEFTWRNLRHRYSMSVKNGVAQLEHRYQKTRIENLEIYETDLEDAISKLLASAADARPQFPVNVQIRTMQRLGYRPPRTVDQSAFVQIKTDGVVEIKDGFNVSSVTENGANDYTISFTDGFETADIVCTPVGVTPRIFEVKEATNLSVRVVFPSNQEPSRIGLWFEEVRDPRMDSTQCHAESI